MDAIFAIIAVFFMFVFNSRASAIISIDFVSTVLAINAAMFFDFWAECAVYFFFIYSIKELVIGHHIKDNNARYVYCASCIFHVFCCLEVYLSENLFLYGTYENFMLFVCVSKLLSAVDWIYYTKEYTYDFRR